ncbi:MAG: methylenetetrahydrofolate reductase [Firmicutes bacterium]|nr:methylenetetrahydrofolate reductase [Bacillota bacterium]
MTRIDAIIKDHQSLSVELWPPRSEEALKKLENSLSRLKELDVDFASITYGAGGTTRDRTHDLVISIKKQQKMTPMAHLTCAYHTKKELTDILRRYQDEGIENILALRGDPPVGKEADFVGGELPYAKDLVLLAKETGNFCVAVAAHPMGHPEQKDEDTEINYLMDKLEVADLVITQLFFSVEKYKAFLDKLAKRGNDKPVLPGIMPIKSMRSLETMARLTNQEVPLQIYEKILALGDDQAAIRSFGVDFATKMASDLLDIGVPGLHFYTMNETLATIEICKNLNYHTQVSL